MARRELNKATWRRARARQKLAHPACAACGATSRLEADHIIPPKLGGSDDPSNIRTLCATCNKRKGDRIMSLAALRAGLHTQPAPTVPARTVYTSRPSRPWQPITGDYSTRRP